MTLSVTSFTATTPLQRTVRPVSQLCAPIDPKIASKITLLGRNTIGNDLPDFNGCRQACKRGQIDRVKEYLKDPMITESREFSTLFFESVAFPEIMQLLFEKNTQDLNISYLGKTPIFLAMEKGYIEAAKLLIRRGANLTGVNDNHETLLHLAASMGEEEVLKELLKKEACKNLINMKDCSGNTPLFKACSRNRGLMTTNIVKLLMSVQGIEMNEKDALGDTPFHMALQNGHTESAYLILNSGRLDLSVNNNDEFAFDLAIKLGYNASFLDLILEPPNDKLLSEFLKPQNEGLEEYYSQGFLKATKENFVQGQVFFLLKSALFNMEEKNFILSVKRLNAALPLLNKIKETLKNQQGCQALEKYILKKLEMIESEPIKAYTKEFGKIRPSKKNFEEAIDGTSPRNDSPFAVVKKSKINNEPKNLTLGSSFPFSLEEKQNKLKEFITIENRQELTTTKFKDLLIYLIAETQADLGVPPVQWACVGRDSMSREDMTPRSKIDFGFLIEKETEKSRAYFTNLSKTLEIKIANLFGENPNANGFFDLQFEDLTAPQKAKIQSIRNLNPKKMGMICYIEGNKGLVESYEKTIKEQHLELGKRMLGGVLIDSSFDPLMPVDPERIYQFYMKSLEGLALCFNVEGKNLFEKINGLTKKGFLCKEDAENLKTRIHQIYSHKPGRDPSIIEDLYDTLFPFLRAISQFYRTGDKKCLLHIAFKQNNETPYKLYAYEKLKQYEGVLQHHEMFDKSKLKIEDRINIDLQFARVQYQLGNIAKVTERLEKLEKEWGATRYLLKSYLEIGFLYLKIKHYHKAKTYFTTAMTNFGDQDPRNAICCFYLSEAYRSLKEWPDLAKKCIKEAQDIALKYLDNKSPFLGLVYSKLALISIEKGELDFVTETDSLGKGEEGLRIQIRSLGKDHPYVIESCINLAEMYLCLKDFKAAFKYLDMALKIYEHSLMQDNPLKIKILELRGQAEKKIKEKRCTFLKI